MAHYFNDRDGKVCYVSKSQHLYLGMECSGDMVALYTDLKIMFWKNDSYSGFSKGEIFKKCAESNERHI